jgi:hypothetical protein
LRRRARCAAALAVLAAAGCTTTLEPRELEGRIEAPWRATSAEPVFVTTPPEGSMGWEKRRVSTTTIRWNDQDFAEEIVARLREELGQMGVPVQEGAARVIELEGVRVSILVALRNHCVIDLNRRLGEGPLRGYQSRGSGSSVEKACQEALSNAVLDTLADPDVERTLRGE